MDPLWSYGASPPGTAGGQPETAREPQLIDEGVPALYVTGPAGGTRHVLPDGIVILGRGPESTIVVDDPRVSRSHAALHVGREIALADLGSANGTTLGQRRLAPQEAEPVLPGQTFFIGDSALVIRPSSLRRTCPQRVSTVEEVRRRMVRLAAEQPETRGSVVLKVRPMRPKRAATWEAILGELLPAPSDWLMWVGQDHLLLGIAVAEDTDGARLERAALALLGAWSATADVESRFISRDALLSAEGGIGGLVFADVPLTLRRGPVVFRDPAMLELKRTVARVAPASVNVLILGETGVGKDVVASMVHELSPRAEKNFVGLNCASLPESLLESELFGYERGAFTGAVVSKPGLIETADGGTLFLDEVGDLSASLQAKLLRVLEAQEVMRVGATRPRRIDVRFVAATNRDLDADVKVGRFRRDLYFRLNAITLTVPPLCRRSSEIEPLARLFLNAAIARFGAAAVDFSPAALTTLRNHPWPGNVRELRNVIDRAVLLATGKTVEPIHLGLATPIEVHRTRVSTLEVATSEPAGSGPPDLQLAERARIERALVENLWNQTRAAQALGIPRRTLVRKIASFGLPRPRKQRR